MNRPLGILVGLWLASAASPVAQAEWEPATPISQGVAPAGVGHQVDLAAGANGLATAFFVRFDGNQPFLARRAADASSWSAPRGLATDGGRTNWEANLAANPTGDTLAIWRFADNFVPPQTAGWPAGAAAPSPAGAVGSRPTHALANSPLVGIDDAGNGYAVTEMGFGSTREVLFYRFDAATQTWSGPTSVAKGEAAQLAVNGDGDVAIAYTRQPLFPDPAFMDRELFVTRKPAGAAEFSAPRKFDFPRSSYDAHSLAVGPDGAITVVFTEDRSGGAFFPQVFARRWLPGHEPENDAEVELLSSPRPAHQPTSAPKVVVDPDGRVTAAWLETNNGLLTYLYAAERKDDRGFGSHDRISESTQQFTDDESSQPPESAPSRNERPVSSFDLAVDADGTATIVYSDSADGLGFEDRDVKAARRATGGRWSAPVSLRSTALGAGAVSAGTNGRQRVAAGRAGQVDVTFIQEVEGKPQLMATRFEGPPPPSGKHQAMVSSFDGTEILVQWCPAAGLEEGERAPTIIAGSGWGIPGRRCAGGNSPEEDVESVFGSTPIEKFTSAGYNVLTFDARGFWRSGGEAQVDDPGYEGKDMQALIDYVASQPNAQLDGPGDPRLGMSGGSYGGGIQFVTAALDQRVDAIAPAIAWNSLVTSLFPRETVKAGWAAILVGAGVPMSTLPGVLSPAGIQQGHMAPKVYTATRQGAAGGTIDAEHRKWFEDKGPHNLLDRIDAPTLIIQGTVDTLFTPDEAHRNFEALRAAGTEVNMLWFCGGHGACERHGEDQEHVDKRVLAWFDRHLRGADVSTGPLFEWVDEDGGWHESEQYPPAEGAVVRGSGSGTLSLSPGELPGSGVLIFATPYSFGGADHPAAVEIPIEAPPNGATLVGAPQLRLRYSATGVSTYGTGVEGAARDRTYVYAQIVDDRRHRVVGNQATPIPITLDGDEHELSLPLERLASQPTSAGYSLQIVPQTSVYDGQRAAGRVELHSIDVELPLANVGSGSAPSAGSTGGVEAAGAQRTATASRSVSKRRPRCRGLQATIVGTPAADVIRGTRRRDVIVARGGNDRILGRGGNDVICAGPGRDVVFGQRGADAVHGGSGNDRLVGGAGRDVLRGERGHDVLLGGAGEDRLSGGRGNDRLSGGRGRDRLLGGAGRDLLRADRRDVRVLGGAGRDRIVRRG